MSGIYKTSINAGDLGDIDVAIQYDYQPKEPQTHDHPGCPASVDITAVVATGMVLSPHTESNLIQHMFNKWYADILEYEDRKARYDV